MKVRLTAGMTALLLLGQWHAVPAIAAESMARFKSERQLQGLSLRALVPPSTRSKQGAVPLTREKVGTAVDARIRAMYDRAIDPATRRVTVASAERAGVGYFVGRFDAMDDDRDGTLTFGEFEAYLDAQSPIGRPAGTAHPETRDIQIIQ